MSNEFSGYILVGGKSSRMGSDKAFLKIGGETFLANAVKILQPVCENRIKIVLNSNQTTFIKKLPQDISRIFDIYKNRGALSGIHAALEDCETKFAIILAVDLPLVTSDVILQMSKAIYDSNEFSAIIPKQKNSKIQPLCGIYVKDECRSTIEKILRNDNSASVKKFIESIETKTIDYKKLKVSSDIFFNVNSPVDYQELHSLKK